MLQSRVTIETRPESVYESRIFHAEHAVDRGHEVITFQHGLCLITLAP